MSKAFTPWRSGLAVRASGIAPQHIQRRDTSLKLSNSLDATGVSQDDSLVSDNCINSDKTQILISVVMPCLNEARTVGKCIDQARAGCQAAFENRAHAAYTAAAGRHPYSERSQAEVSSWLTASYEIIIADNGSADGSQEIAIEHGARLIHVEPVGYGSALLGGFAAAQGKYIVMGDSDCSYDFGDIPRFLAKLEEGHHLVMGNRFAGGIEEGAMPWHHRYIGNPLLSGLGRLLYRTPCRDWHCGLRAFERHEVMNLHLVSPGMELASELVLRAAQEKMKICEIPIRLRCDQRESAPHLRSFRDGFRHLRTLLGNRLARMGRD